MFNFLKKKEKNPENIKELLEQFNDLKKDFNNLSLDFENLKKDHQFSIQKVGMTRFNPFSEIGGDQSFAFALLDGKNNGFVVTSFYTKEGNRVYGKPIKNGKSQYALSQEELKAVEIAEKNNKNNGK